MARSLLFQLAPLSLNFLSGLRQEHHAGTRDIDTRSLLDAIRKVVSANPNRDVFLIIDALDECPQDKYDERQHLLEFLEALRGWTLTNVHVLVTSREYGDIEMVLKMIAQNVPMAEINVNEDILRYISARLCSDSKLSTLPDTLKQVIKRNLMENAQGM
jgi:hypothetical protein